MTTSPETQEKSRLTLSKNARFTIVLSSGLVLVVLLGTLSAGFFVARAYEGRIYPGVKVAGLEMGGLDRLAASELLQHEVDETIDEGLTLTLNGEQVTIPLSPRGATDPDLVYPLLNVDVGGLVEEAFMVGRTGNRLSRTLAPLPVMTFWRHDVPVRATLAETRFEEAVREAFPHAETPGKPTDFAVTVDEKKRVENVTVTEPTVGEMFELTSAKRTLLDDFDDLSLAPLSLSLVTRYEGVKVEEAQELVEEATTALERAPYTLTFTSQSERAREYTITFDELTDWIVPAKKDNAVILSLETAKMEKLFENMRANIDVAAENAVFVMEGDRVTTFVPSRDGLMVDEDELIKGLEAAFTSGITEVAISVARTEPEITTEMSNSLGIKEELGMGYSSFKGSPSNRRGNIGHGVDKLNGLLIAPGETLSLLENLRPFTIADGYLPELVIKGDEIKPEIGGGLCQIGTTTFRAALNSGLNIAERRNHSLVVSYYNDPSNGNPGTDATIYDPAPDLKIKNDTPAHILLTTEMDADTSELFFRFWGTPDGREAHYTPPQVLSWTGYGATVFKETDTLAPGEKRCQSPHPGATASFDYIIKRPDGTEEKQTFLSSYRSLPQICLVGKSAGGEGGEPGTPEPIAPAEEAIPVE